MKDQIRTWATGLATATYVPFFFWLSGRPIWDALIEASEGSSLSLRFRGDEPGGSESINTTGFGGR